MASALAADAFLGPELVFGHEGADEAGKTETLVEKVVSETF